MFDLTFYAIHLFLIKSPADCINRKEKLIYLFLYKKEKKVFFFHGLKNFNDNFFLMLLTSNRHGDTKVYE